MAVKFLDGITVDGGTGSAATIVATGARPVTIKGGGIGSVAIGGSNGGWSTGYFFTGYSGTNRGGFGALGSVDALSYFWIGDAYNDTTMVVQPNAGSVGIGTTAPSDGDLTIGTPKLHVAAGGTSGTFNLAARFQSTTSDADNTGTSILINSSNDRGLLIKAGRKDGDREVAYFDVVGSSGATTNMLSMGKYGSSYNVGIGTTNPAYKLSVENSLQVFSSGDTANPKIEGHLLRVTDTANDNPDVEHRFVENHSLNYGFSWFMDGGNNNFSLRRHDNSANGTTVFRVNRSNDTAYFAGNVGIGTTAPSTKLDILDTVNQTSIRVSNNNYNNYLIQKRRTDNSQILGIQEFGSNGGLSLVTGGSQRLNVNNLGNVGIGTTAPVGKLEVAGNFRLRGNGNGNDSNPIHFTNTSVAISRDDNDLELHAYNAIVFGASTTSYPTSTERMRITNTGNVGIGTTGPSQKLDVNGNIVVSGHLITNTNQDYVKIGVWSYDNTYGIGMTNGFTYGALNNDYAMTFCMNQDNDRGWWWGYDGQSKSTGAMSCNMQGKLKINHSIGLGTVNPSNTQGRIDASNDIVAYSTSDIRLKNNIKTIDSALNKVNKIQGIEFDWIEKEEVHGNSGHDIGVIAQEIEEILPDVVTTRDNGYKAVKYEKIVPLLIEAIKDLSKQVDGLKRLI